MAVWADNATVTINGGTFGNDYDPKFPEQSDLIYVKNGGKVIINGGEFKGLTPRWTLNSHNEKGGTIVFIDKTSNTDIADVSQPLSFAFLLKAYIECAFPYDDAMEEYEEYKYIMVGRMEHIITVKRKRPKFISINTDAQRRFDF